jgi:hypothetical protein
LKVARKATHHQSRKKTRKIYRRWLISSRSQTSDLCVIIFKRLYLNKCSTLRG